MVREVALQVMLWIFFPSLVLLLLFLRLLSRFWNSVDKRINSYKDSLTWFNKTHNSFYSFKKQVSHFQSWKQGGKRSKAREGGKYVVLDVNIAILMLRVQRIQGCKMSLPQLNLSSSTACTQSAASIHCRPGLTVNPGKRGWRPPNTVAFWAHLQACSQHWHHRMALLTVLQDPQQFYWYAFLSPLRITPRTLHTVPMFSAGGWQNQMFSLRCWLGLLYLMLQETILTR